MLPENEQLTLLKAIDYQLDNIDLVNSKFKDWRKSESKNCQEWVITWVYCWTSRYFLTKYVSGSIIATSDTDRLIDEVFFTFYEKYISIKDDSSFAQWISVICKHRFLNYLQRHQKDRFIVAFHEELCIEENFEDDFIQILDTDKFFYSLIDQELSNLPDYIKHVVRKKIWEGKSYDQIAIETQNEVKTVRAYFCRGLKLLRQSDKLQVLAKETL